MLFPNRFFFGDSVGDPLTSYIFFSSKDVGLVLLEFLSKTLLESVLINLNAAVYVYPSLTSNST